MSSSDAASNTSIVGSPESTASRSARSDRYRARITADTPCSSRADASAGLAATIERTSSAAPASIAAKNPSMLPMLWPP